MNSLLKAGKALTAAGARGFASSHVPERKVVVLGAAGGIGQPLGLLMKVGHRRAQLAAGLRLERVCGAALEMKATRRLAIATSMLAAHCPNKL